MRKEEQAIFDACKSGDKEALLTALSYKPSGRLLSPLTKSPPTPVNFNCVDASGRTPLHWGALSGHLEVVEHLLDVGVRTELRDENGFLPVHLSCWSGDARCMLAILRRFPGQCQEKCHDGSTLLHLAVHSNLAPDAVDRILHLGTPIMHVDNKDRTALEIAIQFNKLPQAEVIINHLPDLGNQVDSYKWSKQDIDRAHTLLPLSARLGRTTIINQLVKKGLNVDFRGEEGTSLHVAVKYAQTSSVVCLLQNGASADVMDGDGITVNALLFGVESCTSGLDAKLIDKLRKVFNQAGRATITSVSADGPVYEVVDPDEDSRGLESNVHPYVNVESVVHEYEECLGPEEISNYADPSEMGRRDTSVDVTNEDVTNRAESGSISEEGTQEDGQSTLKGKDPPDALLQPSVSTSRQSGAWASAEESAGPDQCSIPSQEDQSPPPPPPPPPPQEEGVDASRGHEEESPGDMPAALALSAPPPHARLRSGSGGGPAANSTATQDEPDLDWDSVLDILGSVDIDIRGSRFDTDLFQQNLLDNIRQRAVPESIGDWLYQIDLVHLESNFISNGYDDISFLGPDVLNAEVLRLIGISDKDQCGRILDSASSFSPRVPTLSSVHPPLESIHDWLVSLRLQKYEENFNSCDCHSLEDVREAWELALKTNKFGISLLGHRRRLLASLAIKDLRLKLKNNLNEDFDLEVGDLAFPEDHAVAENISQLSQSSASIAPDQGSTVIKRNFISLTDLETGTFDVGFLGVNPFVGIDPTKESLIIACKKRKEKGLQKVPVVRLQVNYSSVKLIDPKKSVVLVETAIPNIQCAALDSDHKTVAYVANMSGQPLCHIFQAFSTEGGQALMNKLNAAFETAYRLVKGQQEDSIASS